MIGSIITEVRDSIDFNESELQKNSLAYVPAPEDVIFPMTPQTLEVSDEATVKVLRQASEEHKPVFVCYTPESVDQSNAKGRAGVICRVLKLLEISEGNTTAFLMPGPLATIERYIRKTPPVRVMAKVYFNKTSQNEEENVEMMALIQSVKDIYLKIVEEFSDDPKDLKAGLESLPDQRLALYFMCCHSPLSVDQKFDVLQAIDFKQQCLNAVRYFSQTYQLMGIKAEVQRATHEELSRQQREHFLRQQMQSIQNELGGTAEDAEEDELKARAEKMKWPQYAADHFVKELKKLQRFNMQNPEYSIQYNYLDTLLNLPWDNYSEDNFELDHVEKVLDSDHYGLEKVKERILEQVAVLKLRSDMKAPILCLYGPPGVGKTSLGRSVAAALGREYCRVSLGGLHDEAEIRGHRRTYIGAMPGRIISAMKNCGTSNPVFVLDEIDKIGRDFKGDPSTALLEVLDPEQNVRFHDNYIDVDYDLSKVLFIATANDLSTISRPLLDRMELVNISGYVTEEKEQIALRHLVDRQLAEHGFSDKEISFSSDAIRYLIDRHTHESGVRQLDKVIARVLRKIARLKASGKEFPVELAQSDIAGLLGSPEVNPEKYENNDIPGVVTGLAWTQAGGEILFVESALSDGKGETLSLTGNLGDVMKESATIAYKYIKTHAAELGIDATSIRGKDVHVHVPEGAIPKDGPSAGITMITSLASSFTRRKVRDKLAMTGEITLRGRITPVGGIKEKILAAKRAGISDIILCNQNRKDVEEIPSAYLEGLSFHYFDRISEALSFAILPKES